MQEMDIFNELIKYEPGLLEKPIEQLVPISFIGEIAVQAYKAIILKMSNLSMTQEQQKKTLADGQAAGKMLLAIEGRIGELIPRAGQGDRVSSDFHAKSEEIKKTGTTNQQRYIARAIADHPAEVAEVIKEAEEQEDIPSKAAVLNKVRFKKEQAKREEAEKQEQIHREKADKREIPEGIISLEEQAYLMKLEKTIYACPKESEIPKHWHEESFNQARKMARIIYNRLEVLLNERENISD